MKEYKNLDDMLEILPEELIERHGLEDMPEDEAFIKTRTILEKRNKLGYKPQFGYHTTNRLYQEGEEINPGDSNGKYKGKIFFSRDFNTLFRGDNPRHCYKIQVSGAHKDPEDLTGKDWFYTLSSAKVVEKVDI